MERFHSPSFFLRARGFSIRESASETPRAHAPCPMSTLGLYHFIEAKIFSPSLNIQAIL
jgi:hypothetical protein